MANSLRQRIRAVKICCFPWKKWKYEIDILPISAKTLFSKSGIEIDILEIELKEEGWLKDNENLLEVLNNKKNLYRELRVDIDISYGDFPDNWDEDDFIFYKKSAIK